MQQALPPAIKIKAVETIEQAVYKLSPALCALSGYIAGSKAQNGDDPRVRRTSMRVDDAIIDTKGIKCNLKYQWEHNILHAILSLVSARQNLSQWTMRSI